MLSRLLLVDTAQKMKKSLMENLIFCAVWFSANFMQFVQCHNKYNILLLVYLFGSWSTFGALWEENILFELGQIRDMETNVRSGLLALSSWSFKIWTRSSHRTWKTRLQSLYIIFESQFGTIIPKIQNLCFTSQTIRLRVAPNYMYLFRCVILI